MHRHRTSVDIGASPQLVWEVMADVERWPEWTSSMSSVELVEGPLRLGARVRIRQPRLPTAVWEVTALDPGRALVWEASSPGLHSSASHTISDRDGLAAVDLELVQRGLAAPLVKVTLSGLTRRYLELEAQGLRQRVERGRRQ